LVVAVKIVTKIAPVANAVSKSPDTPGLVLDPLHLHP